jgi:hypothetical protein
MWGIGKGSINCEQCNSLEELSIQAQAALAAITIESAKGMVGSYFTRFSAQRTVAEWPSRCHDGSGSLVIRRDRTCLGAATEIGVGCDFASGCHDTGQGWAQTGAGERTWMSQVNVIVNR